MSELTEAEVAAIEANFKDAIVCHGSISEMALRLCAAWRSLTEENERLQKELKEVESDATEQSIRAERNYCKMYAEQAAEIKRLTDVNKEHLRQIAEQCVEITTLQEAAEQNQRLIAELRRFTM